MADQRATIAEDQVDIYKEKNKKLSKEITTLMLLLNNSKGSKEALEKHISDNVSLDNYECFQQTLNFRPSIAGRQRSNPKADVKEETKEAEAKN